MFQRTAVEENFKKSSTKRSLAVLVEPYFVLFANFKENIWLATGRNNPNNIRFKTTVFLTTIKTTTAKKKQLVIGVEQNSYCGIFQNISRERDAVILAKFCFNLFSGFRGKYAGT